MSISERVARGLSLRLIAAVALSPVGWTAAGRAGSLCSAQDPSCTPRASLTCCCHSSPGPADAARLTGIAPPTGTPSHGSPMDIQSPPCVSRHVDLRLLYKRLLI